MKNSIKATEQTTENRKQEIEKQNNDIKERNHNTKSMIVTMYPYDPYRLSTYIYLFIQVERLFYKSLLPLQECLHMLPFRAHWQIALS